MDSTFHALGHIVLNGLPTFFLIILLNFFLQRIFFRPLQATLDERYARTEGAQKAADESLAAANRRIADYQAKLRAARAEIYDEQERAHRALGDRQSAAIDVERRRSERALLEAKAELAAEKEAAFETIAQRSDELADRIANAILVKGRAA